MMRQTKNICSILCLLALSIISCAGNKTAKVDSPESTDLNETDNLNFNPFELSRDKDIIPEKFPQTGEISSFIFQSKDTIVNDTSSSFPVDIPEEIDTLNSQVFRVQLFTSKLYGDAKEEAKVAEEIFDRPVFIDYEVPYFKVRVGNFGDKDSAEDYQMTTKTVGYSSAWVVLVNINIKETKPLYEDGYEEGYEEVFDDDMLNDDIIGPDEN
ncbi:MAG: hypothetical protein DRP35_02310 [Candidatus Zixiibacteriota bacterium]|nr:MAG: hypothetical protein DRP35_02310 [candidate division Zixibacteria bacterium]